MEESIDRREAIPPSGRLRKRDVIDIYLAKGTLSAAHLAEKYHISKAHVYDIWKENAWQHIDALRKKVVKRKQFEV